MASKTQHNRKWCLAVFVSVIAWSGLVVSYCLAKMVGKVDDLNFTKQVANWDATATLSDQEMELVTGNGVIEYPITVKNNSGVASDCRIVLTGVPSGVEAKLIGGGIDSDSPLNGTISGNKIIFSNPENSSVLSLNFEQTKTYKIQFSAPLETDGMHTDISVDVELIQKDPNA
jgi:hypothetical protein